MSKEIMSTNTLDRLEEISKELYDLYNELEEIVENNYVLPTIIPDLHEYYRYTNMLIYFIGENICGLR